MPTFKISNCHDCPFSSWSDHAVAFNRGGTMCSLSEKVRIPLKDKAFSFVHKDCPIRKKDYVITYTIKE